MAGLMNRFLDHDGLVKQWPSKRAMQLGVIEYLANKFPQNTTYTELEVNDTLKRLHTFGDWAILRRELCDLGYFDRGINGTEYKRTRKV